MDDSVPASSRSWVDAENLHVERLGTVPDVPASSAAGPGASLRRRPPRAPARGCRSSRRPPGRRRCPRARRSGASAACALPSSSTATVVFGTQRELGRLDREAGRLDRRRGRPRGSRGRSSPGRRRRPARGRRRRRRRRRGRARPRRPRRPATSDDAAALELPGDRAGRAEVAAELGEGVPHVGGGAVAGCRSAPRRSRRRPRGRSPRRRSSRSRRRRRPSPAPFAIARSMLSFGIEYDFAFSIAFWSARLLAGSPPPSLAATMIERASFEKSLPRFASAAPFLCLIDDHLLCPDKRPSRTRVRGTVRGAACRRSAPDGRRRRGSAPRARAPGGRRTRRAPRPPGRPPRSTARG